MTKINKAVIFSVVLLAGGAGFSRAADVSMHALGRKSGLPDTGQTVCYDGGGIVIPVCHAPGDSRAQDGSYWSTASSPSYTLNGISPNQTTTDNRTGLMWATDGAGTGCMSGGVAVATAALAFCEGLPFAGYTDWRLPNVRELMSIVDYGTAALAKINGLYFPNTITNFYLTSTTCVMNPARVWGVYFGTGDVNHYDKSTPYYVRCVRAGP